MTALLLPVFLESWEKDISFKIIDQEAGNILSQKAKLVGFKGKKEEVVTVFTTLSEWGTVEIFLVGMGARNKFTPRDLQQTVAAVLRKAASSKVSTALIMLTERFSLDAFSLGKLLSEALYLSQYRFSKYKTEEKDKTVIEDLQIILQPEKNQSQTAFDKEYKLLQAGALEGKQMSRGVFLARDLVNEPAAHMSPSQIADTAKKIAQDSHGTISVRILDQKECEKLGMGCFLAVAKGSSTEPKFIILHYKPKKQTVKKIALIGKTIIFDSGGLSIKSSKGMETMKMDMAGGATVLGVFNILSNLSTRRAEPSGRRLSNLTTEVFGILPSCENMISGSATRPGDIATALNGKTVEILNTDAEGRLALADALSYAEKYIKPDYIVDLATLTGAIVIALGDDIAGLFANDDNLAAAIEKAALEEGELLWHMSLHKGYIRKMKSTIADLKNVSSSSSGGAITAAVFLSRFVKRAKWAHIDIAGVAFNEEKPQGITPQGATGWGVKTIYRWLINEFS